MNHEIKKRKHGAAKTFVAAVLMVGTVTALFHGMTQVAVAAENRKVAALPTVYPASARATIAPGQTNVEDGYTKPDFTVKDNDLEYYKNSKPTSNDISRDKAAEIGVKALASVFDLDLTGKTIEMGYDAAHDTMRAKWSGEYWVDGKKGPEHPLYAFTVDAVTGEVYTVGYSRVIDAKVDLGYDAALAKSPSAMESIAKQYAEKLDAVGGAVKSSTIDSQGYSGNDPIVTFRIVGENGQRAIIQLSRYDKALLYVCYNGDVVEQDAAIQWIEKQMAELETKRKGSGSGSGVLELVGE